VAAGFVLAFPFRIFSATLEGFQQLRLLGKMRSLIWAASTLTTVISILLGFRVYSLALGWLVSQIGFSLASYLQVRRLFPWLVSTETLLHYSNIVWHDLFRGGWISVGQVAQILISGTDLLVVGHILGPAAVVVYSSTGKLLSALANQPMILINAAMPGLSQMKVAESREKLLSVSTAMGQGMLLIGGAVAVCVLCVNKAFIGLWIGSQFFGGTLLTLLFILNMVFRQLDICFAVALFAFGHEKQMAIKGVADGLFGVGLALLLGPLFGLAGVNGATLLAALLISVPTNMYLLARQCHVSMRQILRPYLPWLWRFTLLAIVAWKASSTTWMASYSHAAVACAATLLLYVAIMATYVPNSQLQPYLRTLTLRISAMMYPWFARPSHTSA
jgi:O-antigen/teichoic acid export membrane protein